MRYIIRKPDGEETTLTMVQLFAAYNNGEVDAVWPAKHLEGDAWVQVGDILEVVPPTLLPGEAGESSSGNPTEPAVLADRAAVAVMRRYADGYRMAKAAVAAGDAVKVVGAGIGVAIVLGGLLLTLLLRGNSMILAATVVSAAGVGIPIWVLGLLVAAVGQLLKATLDGAVQGSPFLEKEEMAEVMSL